ncbi:hypothetical protein LCGC14_2434490 [marine sediment metagenome]|uniref:Uncharacterized protein n=1 Tax=marine sediment metagenome TaxID=412755 RepID=A0A0F9DXX0_9ZZZZ
MSKHIPYVYRITSLIDPTNYEPQESLLIVAPFSDQARIMHPEPDKIDRISCLGPLYARWASNYRGPRTRVTIEG